MEIEFNDLKYMHNINIIDLREKYKFNKKHLSNSKNIPFSYLLINPSDYLKKNEEYVLICDKGIQSRMVSIILNKDGYHTYSLKGGIQKLI